METSVSLNSFLPPEMLYPILNLLDAKADAGCETVCKLWKTIFDDNGNLVSIVVAKASETAPAEHKVDGISGGTITSKGLQAMLLNDFTTYKAFFTKKKQ